MGVITGLPQTTGPTSGASESENDAQLDTEPSLGQFFRKNCGTTADFPTSSVCELSWILENNTAHWKEQRVCNQRDLGFNPSATMCYDLTT